MKRAYLLAALLLLGVAASAPAADNAAGARPGPLPGAALWDYGTWADDYLVVATEYDRKTGHVTWTLEARRKVKAQRYWAHFADPDLLELDTREIHFAPAHPEYKKGAQIKATMKLPASDVMPEVNRVTIGMPP
jgi:hypothetical protein